jgi:hypothetical protein
VPGPAHEDVSNTTTDNSTKDSKPEEKSNEKPIDSNTSDIVLTPNLFEKIGRMYMEASEDRINQAQQMVSLWSVPLDLVLEGVNYVADIANGETPQMHLRWDEGSGFVTDLSYVGLVKRNLQNNINNGIYPITGNKEREQAIVDALNDPVFGAIVNLIGEGIIDPMNYATGAAIKKISALSRAGKIEEAEKLAQELVTDAVPDYMAPRTKGLFLDNYASSKMNYNEWLATTSKEKMPITDIPTREPLRPSEQYTAAAMKETEPNLDLKAYPTDDYEYYDANSPSKQVYDQMGSTGASQNWNSNKFFGAIDNHLLKANSITVIDLRFFSEKQVAEIEAYVYSLPKNQQARIWFIRFPS